MRRLMSFAAFFLLFLLSALCHGEDYSAEHLSRVHLQRVNLYFGWEFEYKSSLVVDDDKPLELENVLTLDAPPDRNSVVIRRLWVAYRKNPGEPHLDDSRLLHRLAGWNGKEFRKFERKYLSANPSGSSVSKGEVYADDRRFYRDNYFDDILTSGPHGIPQYSDPGGKIFESHPAKFRVVGRGERLGIPILQLAAEMAAETGAAFRSEVELTDTPERLLLRQTIYSSEKPVLQCEVTSVGRFEGTLYPASGRLKQVKLGGIRPREYQFNVENVSRSDRSIKGWFPEWPLGTVVIDHANGSMPTVIPYPPEVVSRINISKAKMSPYLARSTWTIVFWLLNLCLLSVLAYFVFRRVQTNDR